MNRRPYQFVPVTVRERRRPVRAVGRFLTSRMFVKLILWAGLITLALTGWLLVVAVVVIIVGLFGCKFGMTRRGTRWETARRPQRPRNRLHPYDQ